MYKHILTCANIESTKNSKEAADKLTDKSLLEHGTVYLYIEDNQQLEEDCGQEQGFTDMDVFNYIRDFFVKNPFSNCMYRHQEGICDKLYITTNYRVIVDNELEFLMKYWHEPTSDFECRYTVKWDIDYPTYIELLQHRLFSFNRISDDFNDDFIFIIPDCMDLVTAGTASANDILNLCKNKLSDDKLPDDERQYFIYLESCANTEIYVNDILKSTGTYYDIVKHVFNASVRVTVYMTGFKEDWLNMIKHELNTANENKRLFSSIYEIIDNLDTLKNEDRYRSNNDANKKD